MTESEGTEPGQLYRGNDLTLQSVLTGFNSGPRSGETLNSTTAFLSPALAFCVASE